MDKKFNHYLLLFFMIFFLSSQAQSASITKMNYPCHFEISLRSWPGTKNDCAGSSCTIPAAFYTHDNCQTYTRASIPTRFSGAHTYHHVNAAGCYQKHCVAVGETSNGENNFIPLSYISDDQGVHWKLSAQQPEPITKDNHRDTLSSFSCNDNGMICTASGKYDKRIEAKWISQDGGDTWVKILPK